MPTPQMSRHGYLQPDSAVYGQHTDLLGFLIADVEGVLNAVEGAIRTARGNSDFTDKGRANAIKSIGVKSIEQMESYKSRRAAIVHSIDQLEGKVQLPGLAQRANALGVDLNTYHARLQEIRSVLSGREARVLLMQAAESDDPNATDILMAAKHDPSYPIQSDAVRKMIDESIELWAAHHRPDEFISLQEANASLREFDSIIAQGQKQVRGMCGVDKPSRVVMTK
jgi:hypothetical protein